MDKTSQDMHDMLTFRLYDCSNQQGERRAKCFTEIMDEARRDGYEAQALQTARQIEDEQGIRFPDYTYMTPAAELKIPGLINLSQVESTETKWLWYPYIPRGKITLMTADPGVGKTYLALYLTANVSAGRAFYGENGNRPPENVIYQTAEDGIADTIKPRLEPMKPDFDRISIIDESQSGLDLCDERIEKMLSALHPALMIFDPLQAYLGADVDMHRANQIRPVLARIGTLAEKYDCAVILIMHNSKMTQNKALHRALGSIDIPAVARSMLMLARDPQDPTRRIMCHEKSSLAARGKSLFFRIEPDVGGVDFCGTSDLTADDVLNFNSGTRDKPSARLDDAAQQLSNLLGDKGWADLVDIHALQSEYDISKSTLYNAKKELQLKSVSCCFGSIKKSYWLLPGIDTEQFRQIREQEFFDSFETVSSL